MNIMETYINLNSIEQNHLIEKIENNRKEVILLRILNQLSLKMVDAKILLKMEEVIIHLFIQMEKLKFHI